jgi:hypothetical protein
VAIKCPVGCTLWCVSGAQAPLPPNCLQGVRGCTWCVPFAAASAIHAQHDVYLHELAGWLARCCICSASAGGMPLQAACASKPSQVIPPAAHPCGGRNAVHWMCGWGSLNTCACGAQLSPALHSRTDLLSAPNVGCSCYPLAQQGAAITSRQVCCLLGSVAYCCRAAPHGMCCLASPRYKIDGSLAGSR